MDTYRLTRWLTRILMAVLLFWLFTKLFPQPDTASNTLSGTPVEADLSYHQDVFDYVMTSVDAGKGYDWKTPAVRGTITPDATYVSKSGSTCRQFKETVETLASKGDQSAIACKRKGADGWCRLKPGNAQTCALETHDIDFQVGEVNFGGFSLGTVGVGGMDVEVKVPPIGGVPGIGGIHGPNTDKAQSYLPNKPAHRPSGIAEWLTNH